MIVIEKNQGPKIEYEVNGTKICFDDDLTINLKKREEDTVSTFLEKLEHLPELQKKELEEISERIKNFNKKRK